VLNPVTVSNSRRLPRTVQPTNRPAPKAAQGLPEETYASRKEGCAKLQSKTAAELGTELDFYVLTGKGLTGYQQACDFVNVTAHCDELVSDSVPYRACAQCSNAASSRSD
jgi:hypothetical protein